MRARLLLGRMCAALLGVSLGCSSDEGDDDGASGSAAVAGSSATGGSSGTSASGGSSGSGASGSAGKGGTTGKGGSAGGGGADVSGGGSGGKGGEAGTPNATGGTTGEAGTPSGGGETGADAEGGAAGSTGVELTGVCGQRLEATVTTDSFAAAFEEYFLIGEEGFGDDICVVRFEVTRVGEGPAGCTDCLWTHTVELGIASVQVDQNGVCGSSELGLDAEGIAALEGTRISYGFVPELEGHASIVMTYIESSGTWEGHTAGTWDETTGFFRFDKRNGFCSY